MLEPLVYDPDPGSGGFTPRARRDAVLEAARLARRSRRRPPEVRIPRGRQRRGRLGVGVPGALRRERGAVDHPLGGRRLRDVPAPDRRRVRRRRVGRRGRPRGLERSGHAGRRGASGLPVGRGEAEDGRDDRPVREARAALDGDLLGPADRRRMVRALLSPSSASGRAEFRILCVTPNPALDRTLDVPDLRIGDTARAYGARVAAGGKGVNVARGLAALGGRPLYMGPLGGASGRILAGLAEAEGLEAAWTWCEVETRTCVILVGPAGRATVVNEPGAAPRDRRLDASVRRGPRAREAGARDLRQRQRASRRAGWRTRRARRRPGGVGPCALDRLERSGARRRSLDAGRPAQDQPRRGGRSARRDSPGRIGVCRRRPAAPRARAGDRRHDPRRRWSGARLARGYRGSASAPPVEIVSAVGAAMRCSPGSWPR